MANILVAVAVAFMFATAAYTNYRIGHKPHVTTPEVKCSAQNSV